MEHQQPSAHPPAHPGAEPKKRMSTGAKVGIGCGSGCLILLVICAIGGIVGWQWLQGKLGEFEADFADKGLNAGPSGQVLEVTEVPTEPTYYKAQMVTFNFTEPVTVEIGVIAQHCDIKQGSFTENVYFRGQIISLQPGVTLEKELNVYCQVVQEAGGQIKGGVTGTYQAKQ